MTVLVCSEARAALRAYAAEQLDAFQPEHELSGDDRDQAIERWARHLLSVGGVPDDILEAMPEASRHNEPQVSPQEYECGCVVVTRITDRDYRRGERPFEMRLAVSCEGGACELSAKRAEAVAMPLDDLEHEVAAVISDDSPRVALALLEGVDLEIVGRSSREDSSAPESESWGRGDVAGLPNLAGGDT